MEGGGQTQNKCGPEGRRGPEGWAPNCRAPSPRVGSGLNVGLWGLGFAGSEKLAKTLKLAKVGLAKVGQHIKTLKLAKVGLAKVGHDRTSHPEPPQDVTGTTSSRW